MEISLNVALQLPEGATTADAVDYVRSAVQCWHGSLQPPDGEVDGDPMFFLNPMMVTVTLMTNDQIKELATYGAQERLKALDAQRVTIDAERETLMAFLQGNGPEPQVSSASSARRKPMSAAARLDASTRMKKIWARRRKAKRDAAKTAEATSPAAESATTETQSAPPAAP